jgi:hypothetical protein
MQCTLRQAKNLCPSQPFALCTRSQRGAERGSASSFCSPRRRGEIRLAREHRPMPLLRLRPEGNCPRSASLVNETVRAARSRARTVKMARGK